MNRLSSESLSRVPRRMASMLGLRELLFPTGSRVAYRSKLASLVSPQQVDHKRTHRAPLGAPPRPRRDERRGSGERRGRERARPLRGSQRGARAVSHVPRVHSPSPIGFPETISSNRPAVITGAFDDWPAMERWNLDYLADAMGDAKVSVNVTPDGRGPSPRTAGPCRASGTTR